ncbi:HMP-PP phosphatase [Erwinia sorbitola]|uniref:HMP-PP phosphatase n=1 Tax=Erwinia sorbitola TaxID=2681984 RepID=A0A6I6F768_9GAMM|nr:HMP-PP phosphatase [Erwinia sorbitola]MTD27097.1 HMP-PP phosphatase [Erwinia sorbitola]QGU89740.1 HMP-PP phosphatase [Erwinia sorbitola]
MVRLAAFDMDGTLLMPDHQLGTQTLHSLRALQAHPVQLSFATGRHYLEMQPLMHKYDLPAFLISGNGTRIHDPFGELLYASDLSPDVARLVIHSHWDTRATLHVFNDNGWFTDDDCPEILKAHQLSGFTYQLTDLRTLPAHQVTKVCFIADYKELCALKIQLREVLGERAHICFSAQDCLEVLPLDCNKGAALAQLAARLDVPMAECMAFGDAMNDLEMLGRVGHGFIMRNAMHELKAKLPHLPVIGDCSTQGVSHYLNHWLTTPHLVYSPE